MFLGLQDKWGNSPHGLGGCSQKGEGVKSLRASSSVCSALHIKESGGGDFVSFPFLTHEAVTSYGSCSPVNRLSQRWKGRGEGEPGKPGRLASISTFCWPITGSNPLNATQCAGDGSFVLSNIRGSLFLLWIFITDSYGLENSRFGLCCLLSVYACACSNCQDTLLQRRKHRRLTTVGYNFFCVVHTIQCKVLNKKNHLLF